jgi:hypothetical protein
MRFPWLLLLAAPLHGQTRNQLIGTWEATYVQTEQVGARPQRRISLETHRAREVYHFNADGTGWHCIANRERPSPREGVCQDIGWAGREQVSVSGEAVDGILSMTSEPQVKLCITHERAASNGRDSWCILITELTATSLVGRNGLVSMGMKKLPDE